MAPSLSLAFACPTCGKVVEGPLGAATSSMACAACSSVTPLPEAPDLAARNVADRCPVCGGGDLYRQSDFSRRAGIGLAAIGLVTGPFTKWISTAAFVGLDALLFLLVPKVAVCYACEAQQRGFEKTKAPPPFDIAVHDLYRFGKRHPPRRDVAVAGPRARLLSREGRAPAT